MLSLPPSIQVTVLSATGPIVPQPGLLVTLALRTKARRYFETPLGVTDAGGTVTMRREAIEAEYQQRQALFPKEYKLGLEDCDPMLEIRVPGGAEFRPQSENALDSALLTSEARSLWAAARNASIAAAEEHIHLTTNLALELVLRVRPANPAFPDGAI